MGSPSWKRFEQKTAKKMLEHDGECDMFQALTTETGRLGGREDLQFDTLSRSYTGECKASTGGNVPRTPFKWFNKILGIAEDYDKEGFLAMKVDGRKFEHNKMHCITPERHYELIEKERKLEELKDDKE